MTAWPSDPKLSDSVQVRKEERSHFIAANHIEVAEDVLLKLSSRCSSWTKIVRILGYCQRFIFNCKQAKPIRGKGVLKTENLVEASRTIIKWIQSQAFSSEIKYLSSKKPLPAKSSIISLHPFLDKEGVLRVGGRLQNSSLSFNVKHPRILPKDHPLTLLIVREMHLRHLHPGASLLVSIIRQDFWIIRLKQLVKRVTHNCIACYRQRAIKPCQLMGNLPESRVTISRPFSRIGVDYAGPILVSTKLGRSAKLSKAYVPLFVCMSTKALHLELVSSLSSEAFVAALRRFVSRRGIPIDIYSDNGTNFVGASRHISELHKLSLQSHKSDSLIANFLSQNSINWHFIPPTAPHFGGLWEACVRSVKSHLRRVIGETKLTFEEMATLLTQIESILNSRPLCPLSDEVNSLDALTPSHFLVGHALTTIPEPNLTEAKVSRLGRWQHLQALMQGFWKRWSRDYLTSLQQRPKWKQPQSSLLINDMVILSEDNIPPTKWALGRIEEVHPGKDGLVRVATVRTVKGLFKRAINRLHRLPIES